MGYFKEFIQNESKEEYYQKLHEYIYHEYDTKTIFPPKEKIFNSLRYCPYEKVKVVIIGQDPYHEKGQAHGMAFSVSPGVKAPPSLINIFKELNRDLGLKIPNNGYLMKWEKQGVLLINSVLTVEEGKPGSHRGKGWETFTDKVIKKIDEKDGPVAFALWGAYAKEKSILLSNPKHLVLMTSHPSPFSVKAGFEGCGHFSKINKYLVENGETPIDWQIEDI